MFQHKEKWRTYFSWSLIAISLIMNHGTQFATAAYYGALDEVEFLRDFDEGLLAGLLGADVLGILFAAVPFVFILLLLRHVFPKDLAGMSSERKYMWMGGLITGTLIVTGTNILCNVIFWRTRYPACNNCSAFDGLIVMFGIPFSLAFGGASVGLYLLIIKIYFSIKKSTA